MEQIRLIKEMRDYDRETNQHRGMEVKPRWMVWENVVGATSSNHGDDFRAVLEETLKVVKKMPLFLDLRQENGQPQDVSWQTDVVSLGEYMTHSTLVSLKDAGGYVYWLTSTDNPHQTYCLNCGEKPMEPRLSKLSQILETNPDPKYKLSARACQGILNRAERRGKTMPPILKEALENQAKV